MKFLFFVGISSKSLRIVEINIVTPLFKGDAKHLLVLNGIGHIVGVYLYNAISTLALRLQYLECFGSVVGCDDAVAHLTFDEFCRCLVAGVAQGTEVAIGTHAVGAACTGVCSGQRCQFKVDVIDKIDFLQRVAHGVAHSSTGRTDMLEAWLRQACRWRP